MAITIQINKEGNLLIEIKYSFRNKDWGEDFAVIQEAIKYKKYNDTIFNESFIDISTCDWTDPIPLLSLLISLNEFKKTGGKSTLIIPTIEDSKIKETDKVLKFLAEEGFLNEFSNCCTIKDKNNLIIDKETENIQNYEAFIKKYKRVSTTVFYTNSTLIKACLFDSKKEFETNPSKVDAWVEEKIKSIRAKISDKVPSYSQGTIIHRITNILVETIQNIVKHAYTDSNYSFAGIYIRYRNGKDNSLLSIEELSNIEKGLQGEEKFCPMLKREFLDLRKGCLEIFVVDSGVGFTESLRSSLPKANAKYAFRESFRHVFKEGKRRKYKEIPDRTLKGGLYLIGEMLKANQDYLCGRDENEWIGTFFPFESDKNNFFLNSTAKKEKVQGLSWIIRLSWRAETEINKTDWSSWDGSPKRHPSYLELESSVTIVNPVKFNVLDQRFNIDSLLIEIYKQKGVKDDKIYFFLPTNNQTKYKLWDTISDISVKLNPSLDRTLIIADIPEFEKRTYTYILDGIHFTTADKSKNWIEKFSKIILISKRLSISILERAENTFKVIKEELRQKYFDAYSKDAFSPHLSIRHLFSWLRAYDSLLFWLNVKLNNKQKQFFVNNEVIWNNELNKIDGYLNFAQTSTDSLSLNIYRNAVERTIGFFDFENQENLKHCYIKQLDPLTSRLVDEYNSTFFNDINNTNENRIYLGSVFVSGMSFNDALFYSKDEKKSKSVLPIYFFKHKDSKADEPVPHLLNWPKEEWLLKDDNFKRTHLPLERVGRTHVIAKYGYKFYTVPRYDPVTKESVYKRTPKETYKDWQDTEQKLLTFGHFEFEGKHDLFKLNLIKKITESFENNDELAQYLVTEFFVLLGGFSKTQLTQSGQKFYDSINERLKTFNSKDEVLLVAYPNNANSSFVIDKIKEFIKPELSERIFSLMPINRERIGASLLVSPLVFDPIIEILNTKEKGSGERKILLFDSTIISGRTRKELKHLLFSLEADEVKTFSIIDRFRLPFKVPDKSKHISYWRFDVPRLGAVESCPICKAIDDIKKFKEDLASEFAQKRIEQWISGWGAVSHFNPVTNGITPTAIEPILKNFGIEFNIESNKHVQIISEEELKKGNDNKIELTNSMGLTIYTTELHSVTSKDDIALSLCKKVKNIPDKAKIELLSSQLLLFPNEYSSHNLFEMALKLFEACNGRDFVDNHSALAAIVLINQNKKLHEKLIDYLFAKDKPILIVNNIDVDLILAFILKKSVQKSNRLTDKVLSLLKYKDDNSALSKYKQFHSEIYNEYGKIHTKPLVTFYLKKDSIDTSIRLRQLNYSLSKMIYLINQIREFRKTSANKAFEEKLKDDCLKALQLVYDGTKVILEKQFKGEFTPENEDFKFRIKQFEGLVENSVVKKLKELHSFLFCNVIEEDDELGIKHPIKNEIKNIINSISELAWKDEATRKGKTQFIQDIPIVKISNTVSDFKEILTLGRTNAWVILDDLIEDEILYFTSNAIHSTEKIPNIWSYDANSNELAHLWISVEYISNFVVVKFVNASAMKAEEIQEIIELKKKRGIIHLKEELKGVLTVENISHEQYINLIQITVKIPII